MPIMNNSDGETVVGIKVVSNDKIISNKTVQIVFALMFGILVIAAVGFAPMEIVHNAAHDVRHIHAFPCH